MRLQALVGPPMLTLSLLRAFALRVLKELLSMSLCLMDPLRSSYIKETLQVLIIIWGGKHYTRLQLALHEAWSTCIEVATHEFCILT